MKKIKSYLKRNYKRLVIQITSIISALILFCIPCLAAEYSLHFILYEGSSSGSLNFGGVYFYMYDSSGSGRYEYYPSFNTFNGVKFRGVTVPNQYTRVVAFSHHPVETETFQSVINKTEKFYINFPILVEMSTTNGNFQGNFEFYLTTIWFIINENGDYKKYTANFSEEAYNSNGYSSKVFNVGFTVEPTEAPLDIVDVGFSFEVPKQNSTYYVQYAPYGNITIKTGLDIPVNAPVVDKSVGDLHSMESSLIDSQKDSLNEAAEMFGSFEDTLKGYPYLINSFGAISAIVNDVVHKVPGLHLILIVSLVLGFFAFIVGMTHSISSSIDDSMSDESLNRSAQRSYEVQRRVQNIRKENYERSKKK